MNTIEDRLQQGSRDVRLAVATLPNRSVPGRRHRSVPAVAFAVGVLTVLLLGIPLIMFRGGADQTGDATHTGESPATVSTVPDDTETSVPTTAEIPSAPEDVSIDAPQVTVTEIDSGETSAVGPPTESGSGDTIQFLGNLSASTGNTFESFPDFVPDAATRDGRVVIVGGNATRTAGIWYSDGGAWIPAIIEFPDDMTIGEAPGDYRLADGIQNIKVTKSGFAAWEPVQLVTNVDMEYVGSLLLVSTDGATWTASLVEDDVGDIVEWQHGYLVLVSDDDIPATATARWSADLETWIDVADLGRGIVYEATAEDDTVKVALIVYAADDGVRTVRRVSLEAVAP